MQHRFKQSASAILMGVMFMAITATLAIALSYRQSTLTELSRLLREGEIYNQLEQQGLAWAQKVLSYDEDAEPDHIDELEGDWAKPYQLEQQGVTLTAQLIDASSLYNLNSLYAKIEKKSKRKNKEEDQEDSANKIAPSKVSSLVFQRILLRLKEHIPKANFDATRISKDLFTWLNGTSTDKSKRKASTIPMYSVSELRLLESVDAKTYEQISPYLIVLPMLPGGSLLQNQPHNINTVSPAVLSGILDISIDAARSVADSRPLRETAEINTLLSKYIGEESDVAGQFDLKSDFYLLKLVMRSRSKAMVRYAMLYRQTPEMVNTLWQSHGTF